MQWQCRISKSYVEVPRREGGLSWWSPFHSAQDPDFRWFWGSPSSSRCSKIGKKWHKRSSVLRRRRLGWRHFGPAPRWRGRRPGRGRLPGWRVLPLMLGLGSNGNQWEPRWKSFWGHHFGVKSLWERWEGIRRVSTAARLVEWAASIHFHWLREWELPVFRTHGIEVIGSVDEKERCIYLTTRFEWILLSTIFGMMMLKPLPKYVPWSVGINVQTFHYGMYEHIPYTMFWVQHIWYMISIIWTVNPPFLPMELRYSSSTQSVLWATLSLGVEEASPCDALKLTWIWIWCSRQRGVVFLVTKAAGPKGGTRTCLGLGLWCLKREILIGDASKPKADWIFSTCS